MKHYVDIALLFFSLYHQQCTSVHFQMALCSVLSLASLKELTERRKGVEGWEGGGAGERSCVCVFLEGEIGGWTFF